MLSKFMFFCKVPGEYTIVEHSLGLGFFQYIYIPRKSASLPMRPTIFRKNLHFIYKTKGPRFHISARLLFPLPQPRPDYVFFEPWRGKPSQDPILP